MAAAGFCAGKASLEPLNKVQKKDPFRWAGFVDPHHRSLALIILKAGNPLISSCGVGRLFPAKQSHPICLTNSPMALYTFSAPFPNNIP